VGIKLERCNTAIAVLALIFSGVIYRLGTSNSNDADKARAKSEARQEKVNKGQHDVDVELKKEESAIEARIATIMRTQVPGQIDDYSPSKEVVVVLNKSDSIAHDARLVFYNSGDHHSPDYYLQIGDITSCRKVTLTFSKAATHWMKIKSPSFTYRVNEDYWIRDGKRFEPLGGQPPNKGIPLDSKTGKVVWFESVVQDINNCT